MIKAQELRLGNMIKYGAHGVVIVNEIKATGKVRVKSCEHTFYVIKNDTMS